MGSGNPSFYHVFSLLSNYQCCSTFTFKEFVLKELYTIGKMSAKEKAGHKAFPMGF